ncbi:MAG: LapA family protein [Gammaproteobacteria bacterium]|nr:LapA family protein [Gammaproteobacteria bacterium]
MIRIINLFLVILVIVFLGILAYLNSDPVHFDYFLASTELPLSILLLFCFLLGVLLSAFAMAGLIIVQKWKIKNITSSVDH